VAKIIFISKEKHKDCILIVERRVIMLEELNYVRKIEVNN
jgi:hypothetical protein